MAKMTVDQTALLQAGATNSSAPRTPPEGARVTSWLQGRKVSFVMSTFNLCNAIMGSGILGLPFVCSRIGVLPFVLLMMTMVVIVEYSLSLLLLACRNSNKYSYEDLGAEAFGPIGRRLVASTICVQNTGSMTSYMVVMGDLLPDLLHQVFPDSADSAWLERKTVMCLVGFVLVLPLAMARKINFIGVASAISFSCMLLMMAVVIFRSGTIREDSEYFDTPPKVELAIASDTLFLAIPTMCFSFLCHTSLLPVFAELREGDSLARKERSKVRIQRVARTAISLAFLIYSAVSVFGYISFGDQVNRELLLSYVDWNEHDDLIMAVRVAFTISVTMTIPLMCFPFRKAFSELVFGNSQFYFWRHVICTTIIITTVLLLALYVPAITAVFGLVGATSSVTLVFLLPTAIYLKLGYGHGNQRAMCYGMFCLGIVIAVVSLGGLIRSWVINGFE